MRVIFKKCAKHWVSRAPMLERHIEGKESPREETVKVSFRELL